MLATPPAHNPDLWRFPAVAATGNAWCTGYCEPADDRRPPLEDACFYPTGPGGVTRYANKAAMSVASMLASLSFAARWLRWL